MDDPFLIGALARVYAAGYSSSGVHVGMNAMTDPPTARANGRAAVKDFLAQLDEIKRGEG